MRSVLFSSIKTTLCADVFALTPAESNANESPGRRMRTVRGASAAVAASVSIAMAIPARADEAPEKLCPDATDAVYSVKMGDTLWGITARAYCLTDWPPLFYGW